MDQEGKSGQIETANYDEGSEQEKLIDHFPLPGPTRLVEPIGKQCIVIFSHFLPTASCN